MRRVADALDPNENSAIARDPYLVVERLAPDRDRLRGDDSRAGGCGLEELGPMTGSEGEVTDLDARLWHLWLRG